MPDDAIERRLAAVERALTDGHDDLADLRAGADLAARVDDLETTAERLERRVADLDAAVQALRGYVGNARSVNRAVERRADAALATAERAAGDPPAERAAGDPPDDQPAVDDAPVDGPLSPRTTAIGHDSTAGHGPPD